jgi:hypothetical protein
VALQGTIDTFALADVLRLLASTSKTGRLTLEGDRGSGAVAVADGRVHGVDVPQGSGPSVPAEESLFELLRFREGDFVFDADDGVDTAEGEGHDLEPLLARANELLEEWERIEAVVPSPRAWLTLSAAIPGEEVAIDADRWRVVALIGSGASASGLAEALGATELVTGRLVISLAELGVVQVGDEAIDAATDDPPQSFDTESTTGEEPDATVVPFVSNGDGGGAPDHGATEPPASWFDAPMSAAGSNLTAGNGEDDEDGSAAEFARHLANLSPKAAKAVAKAARAGSVEERDRVLAEVEASEAGIDHDLLLRFLGDSER